MTSDTTWIAIGFPGQALFTSRFLVQWITSEQRGESVIPLALWWFSILGGLTLLSYALWRQDPVFIVGQGTGLVAHARTLIPIARKHRTVTT